MLKNEALKILNINKNENITIELIKKKFKNKARELHPDKNKSKNANNEFIQIHEAYEILSNDMNKNQLKDILKDKLYTNKLELINLMMNKYEKNSILYIKKIINNIDSTTLKHIYHFIKNKNDVLEIPKKIYEIIEEKIKNEKIINLNPNIDDLFENNVYKLILDDRTYIIPLWHHELTYEHNNKEIIIKNTPITENNIEIDNDNNIKIKLTYNIKEIWNKEKIYFSIGKREFYITKNNIKLMKKQTIVLKNKGIARINTFNVFDISNLSNIIIELYLNI